MDNYELIDDLAYELGYDNENDISALGAVIVPYNIHLTDIQSFLRTKNCKVLVTWRSHGSYAYEYFIWKGDNAIGKHERYGTFYSWKEYTEALEAGLIDALKTLLNKHTEQN